MPSSACDWSSDVCSSDRSEEHTSELQSRSDLVCRLLLEKKKKKYAQQIRTEQPTYERKSPSDEVRRQLLDTYMTRSQTHMAEGRRPRRERSASDQGRDTT